MKIKKYFSVVAMLGASMGMYSQVSINTSGGDHSSSTGQLSHSVGQIVYTAYYASSSGASLLQGVQIPHETFGDSTDCSVFDTAPVDLTKSFDPVNGVQDRVQVKWFKESPQVRYSDEDAAACDIKFWPKRDLIPGTTTPTGPVIVAAPEDTTRIIDAKKFLGDGVSPREIFKWPVKFRKASDSPSAKRADPNIRYEWQVRCACEHGAGQESPWSEIKIFNTPDFDIETGIYTASAGQESRSASGLSTFDRFEVQILPNPNNGDFRLRFNTEEELEDVMINLFNLQGRSIVQHVCDLSKGERDLEWNKVDDLSPGLYFLEIRTQSHRQVVQVMIE